ncbi:MAG: hypothetical protein JO166_24945 [Deltaproteobacteria bacterium]|nr:hypothetical protein [Deltaproteobacteria bacterium]
MRNTSRIPLWARKMKEFSCAHVRDMRSLMVTVMGYAVKHRGSTGVAYNEASLSENPTVSTPEWRTFSDEEGRSLPLDHPRPAV